MPAEHMRRGIGVPPAESCPGENSIGEPFVVPGATRTPRLWRPDLALLSRTRDPHPLLRSDGSTVIEVIRSLHVPSGLTNAVPDRQDREDARGAAIEAPLGTRPLLLGGSLDTAVRRFLSTFASRSTPDYAIGEDRVAGIDWNFSYNSTPGNLEGVTAPLLVVGMTGHYWIVFAGTAYEHAASRDKSIAFVEGTTHGFTPCEPCARSPRQFGDTMARTFDHVAAWIAACFVPGGAIVRERAL